MDLKMSLVDTNIRIYPSKTMLTFLESLPIEINKPINISQVIQKSHSHHHDIENNVDLETGVLITKKDLDILNKVKKTLNELEIRDFKATKKGELKTNSKENEKLNEDKQENEEKYEHRQENEPIKPKQHAPVRNNEKPYLTTSDIDWLYSFLQKKRISGDKKVPYLHELMQGTQIEMPENKLIKRNPILEARCVKLRAQQEAREYRKMTKGVDNVRMRFPEDSISYQLKQVNRQLIAIGQFIISIFAGFLFGFRGVEWMVGNLDFGFRLLLGVMCALVIALAEIYFLAKKLNEELNIPETVQLGGPPKFVDDKTYIEKPVTAEVDKPHQD